MKKKFKSLLALVLVVILAFSAFGLTTFAATGYSQIAYEGDYLTPSEGMGSWGYPLMGAELVIFKKGSDEAHVWVSSSVTLSDDDIWDTVRAADASLKSYTDEQIILHDGNFTADKFSVEMYWSTITDSYWIKVLGESVSHMILLNLYDLETGSLTVQKTVSDDSEDMDPAEGDYLVNVLFTGSNLHLIDSGDLVGVEGDGTLTFSFFLDKDAQVQFTNIPKNVQYTVSENSFVPGWSETDNSTAKTRTIGKNGNWNFTCVLENIYVTPTGELTVNKEIINKPSRRDCSSDYLINVIFTGTDGNLGQIRDNKDSISGTLSPDGNTLTYSFFRDHGKNITFSKIPLGTNYTVSETINYANCINTDTLPLSGTIDLTHLDIDLTLHNEYRDNTTFDVQKLVTDTDEIAGSGDYLINVTFTSDYDISDITCDAPGAVKDPASTAYSVTFSFFLGDTDKATFYNVPKGAAYSVTESSFADGWKLVGIVHNTAVPGTVDGLSVAAATLRCPPPPPPADVIVTNTYDPDGSLAITKAIAGTSPTPTSADYTISVVFSGADLDQIEYTGTEISDVLDAVADPNTRTVTFFLLDSETFTFTEIPAGTDYSIDESVTGRWVKDADLAIAGTIDIADADTATITNSYDYPDPGSLTVTKLVESDADNLPDSGYEVVVRFEGTGLDAITTNLAADDYDLTTGTGYAEYSFFLADGSSAVFSGIPAGTDYSIDENIDDGETRWALDSISRYDGSITDGDQDTVTVNNTYTPPSGDLRVTKDVVQEGRVWNEDLFKYSVTFSTGSAEDYIDLDEPNTSMDLDDLDLQYSQVGDGGAVTFTFYLDDDAYIVFSGIPAGVDYTVTETETRGADSVRINGIDQTTTSGTFEYDNDGEGSGDFVESVTLNFVNYFSYNPPGEEPGNLTVTKNVTGTTSMWNGDRFLFTVALEDVGEPEMSVALFSAIGSGGTYSYVADGITDEDLGMTVGDITIGDTHYILFTFSLSDDESIIFSNIYPGTKYIVTETNNRGATSTTTSGDSTNGTFEGQWVDQQEYFDTIDRTVNFINDYTTYYSPSYYNLTVNKALAGNAANTDDLFDFAVTLSNFAGVRYSINGAASVAVTAGVTTVQLGDGDTVVFTNILEGTTFSVTESGFGDYAVSAAGDGMTIDSATASGSMNSSKTVNYTNTKNGETPPPPPSESGVLSDEDDSGVLAEEDTLPQTGGISGSTGLAIFGALLLGAGAILGLKKKREDRD